MLNIILSDVGLNGVSMMSHVDLNHDGRVSDQEIANYEKINNLQLAHTRDCNHIKLAWVAMVSIVGVTLLLFTPFVDPEKIIALQEIIELFYIAQASIVGFYMGAKTYLDRNK